MEIKIKYMRLVCLNICIIILIIFIGSCDNKTNKTNKTNDENLVKNNCPCDSLGTFKIKDKKVTYCYIRKSQIEIKRTYNDDTIEVTRYFTTDNIWHVQEYILIAKNKIIIPELSIYCDIKDTASFYKLTFIRNENLNRGKNEPIIDSFLGLELTVGSDTLKSNNINILIDKKTLKGIVKIEKKLGCIYNGERGILRPSIYIEAETLIKYGNLLNQFKIINENCSK